MKKTISLMLTALLLCGCAGALAEEAVEAIIAARTTNAFTGEAVDEAALEKIVQAGLSATSGRNTQPWFFAVITNADVMAELSGSGQMPQDAMAQGEPLEGIPPENGMPAGGEIPENAPPSDAAMPAGGGQGARAGLGSTPVAIIIYTDTAALQGAYAGSNTAVFDCGLATQNMVTAANLLGYGTKIVAAPTDTLNGEQHDALCALLGVDTSLSAVAILLIGVADDSADATTSASVREAEESRVSYIP